MESECRPCGIVQLLAVEKPSRVTKMKKIIILAIVLGGLIGASKSRAGVAFGITLDNGRGYVSGGYSQPSYGTVYGGQYRYTRDYYNGYGYNQHDALHDDLRAGHSDLHQDLREQHVDQHRDLRRDHLAVHRQLRQERAYGVPWYERQAEHEAAHEWLSDEHRAGHEDLRDQHSDGHEDLRREHRSGHYDLGW